LATQLGHGLCGTLYVLDEPSIGLHASDTHRMIRIVRRLRDQGNAVVIVEHDADVMRAADYLIELGPGGGSRGGKLVSIGTPDHLKVLDESGSRLKAYLDGSFSISTRTQKRPESKTWLSLIGASENNLKNVRADFPLE
jgi:excinuclease ABC subunit A